MKNALVKTILALFICLVMMPNFTVLAAVYPFTNGNYVQYTITATVTAPTQATISGTAKIIVTGVSGTTVSGTLEMNLAGIYNMPSTPFSINVATGAGAEGNAFFIIAANLTQGQAIPGVAASVTGVADRTYAGASRRCVYSSANIPGFGPASLYWDQATGVLVEMSASMTSGGMTINMAFVATETNIWSGAGPLGNMMLWIIVGIVVVAIVVVGVVLLMRRRKPPVAQPPLPTPPAPPPPTSLG